MPKNTKKYKSRTNKGTRKNNKQKKQNVRKISNPSGLSHLYTSIYGPRAYKGGLAMVI
jgi:hypothetical protein